MNSEVGIRKWEFGSGNSEFGSGNSEACPSKQYEDPYGARMRRVYPDEPSEDGHARKVQPAEQRGEAKPSPSWPDMGSGKAAIRLYATLGEGGSAEDYDQHPDDDRHLPGADSGTLIIAIGNDGRQDDGLGWAFAGMLEEEEQFTGTVVYRYQLQVEDALLITTCPRVIFVDASQEQLPGGYEYSAIQPAVDFEYTTHQMAPEAILGLAKELYDIQPEAYLLCIQGNNWELARGLSPLAAKNLNKAFRELSPKILY